MRRTLVSFWMVTALFWSHAEAAVSPQLQHAIRENTFEVVMKKPDKDPAIYEKALPLDLLPFRERTDTYQSIGTAFSLGNNTYVTAAHVIALGIDGQYGSPELRGSDGTAYPIDRILRFSLHEDFVVFSLVHDPNPVGFSVDRDPKIDDPVLAVGNAFGEGIVIRDGLYTSATDEDQDGRWKWIRFSAAASPGNSGGPLLDDEGKVIGIVIGKSPNENLNFSLPIARVLDAEDHKARFAQRVLTSLPFLHGTYTYSYEDAFALPLTWPEFAAAYESVIVRHADEARTALLRTYQDSLFPKGPGSDNVLFAPNANGFRPFVITQEADGSWGVDAPDYKSINLPADGSIDVATAEGATLLRLVRSDAAADDAFYEDSKSFMDLALKALNLRRAVGPDQVRVVSLGAAKTDEMFTDSHGRKWQERIWAVPFLNLYVVGLLLPTPDGYAALVSYAPSVTLRPAKEQARLLTSQVGISLSGTLKQWQAYLNRRMLLPKMFADVSLNRSPDWSLHTRRFTSTVPASVMPLTDKSPMSLTMGFINESAKPVWDITEVWWNTDARKDTGLGLWRRERPPSDALLELRNDFESMRSRGAPYDGQLARDTKESFSVTKILDIPGHSAGTVSADALYGLTIQLGGHPTLQFAAQSLESATAASHISERGWGADISPAPATGAQSTDAYENFVEQAVSAAKQTEAYFGEDLRGHRVSQDIREFYDARKAKTLSLPVGTDAAENWQTEQNRQLQALQSYWRQYPGVTHNRDMWSTFLAKNNLPPNTPHEAAVTSAEDALRSSLASGVPSADWSTRAEALRAAYVNERSRLTRARTIAAADYRTRASPCPPPADKTSGKKMPSVRKMNRSLEDYWPAESKRLGEEGVVLVSLRISATGCADAAAIAGSSGSAMLDEAVMQFYETIDFFPAEIDGKWAKSTPILPITFKLRN